MKHGTHSERNKKIIRRVLNGETLAAVGRDYKLTGSRVRSILDQAMYRLFKNNNFAGASTIREISKISLKNWRASKNYVLARL